VWREGEKGAWLLGAWVDGRVGDAVLVVDVGFMVGVGEVAMKKGGDEEDLDFWGQERGEKSKAYRRRVRSRG